MDKKILFLFLIFCCVLYSFIAITSHNHFQTFGWDLGYFDQLIWKVSRGIYPFSTLSQVNLLAGHFAPILFLFAPLYWIWSDPRVLLIAQSVLMVLAAWPLYLLAFEKTQNKLFSFTVVFSYLFFIGTQWSILNEFHEITVVPLFLTIVFYALEKGKKVMFWLGIIGLFFAKEEIAILVAAIGLMIFFYFKKKKLGISLMIFSLLFFFFLTNFFMPAISEKGIYQHEHLSSVAKTPQEFLLKIVVDPFFALRSLVTPPEKINTLASSLLSFSLLPIFAPLGILLPLIEQFLIRFLYTGPQYTFWQNVNHHAAPTAMLLAISSIYGATVLIKKIHLSKSRILRIIAVFIFAATVGQDILLKAPIHSIFKKQFYETQSWMKDNSILLTKVNGFSPDVPIATQNSLFPHLSQREKIYLLPELKDAEFIMVDLHDGPNKYAPLSYNEIKELIGGFTIDGKFTIIDKQGEAVLLQRSNK